MRKAWAVYPHSEDGRATGRGFVARPGDLLDYPQEHGAMLRAHRFRPVDTRNYGDASPIKVYYRRADAEKEASRCTASSSWWTDQQQRA